MGVIPSVKFGSPTKRSPWLLPDISDDLTDDSLRDKDWSALGSNLHGSAETVEMMGGWWKLNRSVEQLCHVMSCGFRGVNE